MSQKTPVALFAFNRVDTLQRVLARLALCENLQGRAFYVFIDGPRNEIDKPKISLVRDVVERFRRQCLPAIDIIQRQSNLGNPRNIPLGISQVLDAHGRAIILEDDILVSRYFLSYMDEALDVYENDSRIWCINAWRSRFVKIPPKYQHDVYLDNRNMCWGWGTWKSRWSSVDLTMKDYDDFIVDTSNIELIYAAGIELKRMLDMQFAGNLHTWDVQCSYHMIKNRLWAIEPRYALTKNIGFGTESAHCSGGNAAISTARFYNFRPRLPKLVEPDERIVRQFRHTSVDSRIWGRIARKLLRHLWSLGPMHDEPIGV